MFIRGCVNGYKDLVRDEIIATFFVKLLINQANPYQPTTFINLQLSLNKCISFF